MTNGTMIDTTKIDILKKLGLVKLEISIDGNQLLHNENRPLLNNEDSYYKIIENLKNVKNTIPIVVRVNIDKINKWSITKLLDDLVCCELNEYINVYFTDIITCKDDSCMKDFSYIDLYKFISFCYETAILKNFSIALRAYSIGPCHSMKKFSFGIKPNGDILKCLAIEESKITTLEEIDVINQFKYDNFCEDFNCTYYPICFGGCMYSNLITKKCPKDLIREINLGIVKGKVKKYYIEKGC